MVAEEKGEDGGVKVEGVLRINGMLADYLIRFSRSLTREEYMSLCEHILTWARLSNVKSVRPNSGEVSYAVQVARKPWEFSERTIRASQKVLIAGGYKNLAESCGLFLGVDKSG